MNEKSISIVKVMDKDHKKIINLLNIFEKEIINHFNSSHITFEKLKWNIEKHFFIEEKAIFDLDNFEENKDDIEMLIKDHLEIYNLLYEVENAIYKNKIPNLNVLIKALNSHSNYEDEVFYPRLDELLSNDQKLNMINRIKEVTIN